MNPMTLEPLIPILTTLIALGMPVAIVFIVKYFTLKHRELDLDAEHQKKWTEEQRRQLEHRVASLENAMQTVLQIATRLPAAPPLGLGAMVTPQQLVQAGAEGPPLAPPGQAFPAQRERG